MRRILEVDGNAHVVESMTLWACVLVSANVSMCVSHPKCLSEPPVHGNGFYVHYLCMDHVHAMNITYFALGKNKKIP